MGITIEIKKTRHKQKLKSMKFLSIFPMRNHFFSLNNNKKVDDENENRKKSE